MLQVLTAHLLHETTKGHMSQWHPYLAQLPHEYTLMMNFNPEHVRALQAPHAQQTATTTCQQPQQSWTEAKGLLSMLGSLCWQSLTLGLCVRQHGQACCPIVQVCRGAAGLPVSCICNASMLACTTVILCQACLIKLISAVSGAHHQWCHRIACLRSIAHFMTVHQMLSYKKCQVTARERLQM